MANNLSDLINLKKYDISAIGSICKKCHKNIEIYIYLTT